MSQFENDGVLPGNQIVTSYLDGDKIYFRKNNFTSVPTVEIFTDHDVPIKFRNMPYIQINKIKATEMIRFDQDHEDADNVMLRFTDSDTIDFMGNNVVGLSMSPTNISSTTVFNSLYNEVRRIWTLIGGAIDGATNTNTATGSNGVNGTIALSGGSIDNCTIGNTSPSTALFTNASATILGGQTIWCQNNQFYLASGNLLDAGSNGQVLTTNGDAQNPNVSWSTIPFQDRIVDGNSSIVVTNNSDSVFTSDNDEYLRYDASENALLLPVESRITNGVVSGGSIDGTPIGDTSRSTGKFTTVDATTSVTATQVVVTSAGLGNNALQVGTSFSNIAVNAAQFGDNVEVLQRTGSYSTLSLRSAVNNVSASIRMRMNFTGTEYEAMLFEAGIGSHITYRNNGETILRNYATKSVGDYIIPHFTANSFHETFKINFEGRCQTRGLQPLANNFYDCGQSGSRWSTVYAQTGTINTSDRRQKTNIIPTPLGLDFLMQLKPVEFETRDSLTGRRHQGFIAQDIMQLIAAKYPDNSGDTRKTKLALVCHDDIPAKRITRRRGDGTLEDREVEPATDLYSLRYTELIGPMTRAIQELSAKVSALEVELEKIKVTNGVSESSRKRKREE